MRRIDGVMVPVCRCGEVKETLQIDEALVEVNTVMSQPDPEVEKFRKDYQDMIKSPEVQAKITSGQYGMDHVDSTATKRKTND